MLEYDKIFGGNKGLVLLNVKVRWNKVHSTLILKNSSFQTFESKKQERDFVGNGIPEILYFYTVRYCLMRFVQSMFSA